LTNPVVICFGYAVLEPQEVIMKNVNLILSLPQGTCTATSLGLEGFAQHRSPGHGQFFDGRAIDMDLKIDGTTPSFEFYNEGGWRDAMGDTKTALAACETRRTKTALSNNAFSAIPIDAYRAVALVKTGGQLLPLEPAGELFHFKSHDCREDMTSEQVAQAAGLSMQVNRHPRCYMVFGPLEFVVLSNLTPEEYVWYATHRPGKVFRQVVFAEIKPNPRYLMAQQLFEAARDELAKNPNKKTKTVYHGSAFDKVPFNTWVGYEENVRGGLYCGDRNKVTLWKWPAKLASAWQRAEG
jgi:hypothetical protein